MLHFNPVCKCAILIYFFFLLSILAKLYNYTFLTYRGNDLIGKKRFEKMKLKVQRLTIHAKNQKYKILHTEFSHFEIRNNNKQTLLEKTSKNKV
jgi:hypothetical protein